MGIDNSKIFISYSRKASEEFARRLYNDLRSKGLNIWLDKINIHPGEIWDDEIEKALESSGQFLIILSPESVSTINVMDELNFALEEGKVIIPVLHIDCKIPFRIRRRQYCDFTKNYNNGLNDLLKEDSILQVNTKSEPDQKVPQINSGNEMPLENIANRVIWINEKEGLFIDIRDNKKYKVVRIGEQIWMAQNLAFEVNVGNSWAYKNNKDNIAEYGYLYDWHGAMNAIPEGWKLPSKSDFKSLINSFSNKEEAREELLEEGGSSGFNAIGHSPRYGERNIPKWRCGNTEYWSSSEYNSEKVYTLELLNYEKPWIAQISNIPKDCGLTVRCILDK